MSRVAQIYQRSLQLEKQIVEYRREFHRYPELGFQEVRTAERVASILTSMGLEVTTGIAGTGVVGVLRGEKRGAGKTVALRADMDALPLNDTKETSYASRIPGVMHACGHDGHMAIVLGAAHVLAERRSEIPGNVKFIFQPAEESPGGARPMIEQGVLENPHVDAVIGVHLWVDLEVGKIGIQYGAVMAAVDQFTLVIKGQGGHGAAPHKTVDAITVAAQVISALQNIASRQVDPIKPVVLSIGTIQGGSRHNIIAESVTMTGTVRTLQPELREKMPGMIEQIVAGVTSAFGARYELNYEKSYPITVNDSKITSLCEKVARDILGDGRVEVRTGPSMGSEDFAFFLEKLPGTYALIGAGNSSKGVSYPHHHNKFDIDEKALAIGTAFMAESALRILEA